MKCELRLNDDKQELYIDTLIFTEMPKQGDFILVSKRGEVSRYKIAEVWHYFKVSHKVVLYVNCVVQ